MQRGNGDRHLVIKTNAKAELLPDLIWTRCLVADQPYESMDGKLSEIIWKPGQKDFMCADDVELIERPDRDPETIEL